MSIFLGIDPGKKGGLCAIYENIPYVIKMPETEVDTWAFFQHIKQLDDPAYAVIEQVHGFIGNTHNKGHGDKQGNLGTAPAMFNFGRSYGFLRGCITALGLVEGNNFQAVPPKKWQAHFGISREKGEKDSPWKGRLAELARSLFPDDKILKEAADSVLLALYCRSVYGGIDE